MKKQLHIYIQILLYTILVFINCKHKNPTNFFLNQDSNSENFSISFLKNNYEDWINGSIDLKNIYKSKIYIKEGNPTNQKPIFLKGCFYFLDLFYFYNEYGFTFQYCNSEILQYENELNNYIDNIENLYNHNFSLNTIKIEKTNFEKLKKQKYFIIYNTFLDKTIQDNLKDFTFNRFFYSDKFYYPESQNTYLPKRFYETEYLLLIKNDSILFIYKINSDYLSISILDKKIINIFIDFFNKIYFNIQEFSIDNNFSLDMVFFNYNSIKKFRIASEHNMVYIKNPKDNNYIILLPYSYIIYNIEDFHYYWNNNQFVLDLKEEKQFSIFFKDGVLYNQWMILQENLYIPLELCLWQPCSIKDLNFYEFLNPTDSLFNESCNISKFIVTEVNPYGIYINQSLNPYGKFIEIKSLQNCNNKVNKIYLKIQETLIPLPEQISDIYYLFTASENFYYYTQQISHPKINSLQLYNSIKLVQFFPYEEYILFSGFSNSQQENIYFINGDKNNKIFKKIHSIIFNNNDWEFHSPSCIGTIECNQYGMSPGYENILNLNYKICNISEILIGGPYDFSNKRLSSDEFIELECKPYQNQNKNILKIFYNNHYKTFYFPSPDLNINFFTVFPDEPQCISSENSLIIKDLTIPNDITTYQSNNTNIYITKYQLENYILKEYPQSLNYIQEYNLLLPTKENHSLTNCKGYATPNHTNYPIPFLYTNLYNNKIYSLISGDSYNNIRIQNKYENTIKETTIYAGSNLFLEDELFPLEQVGERDLIKIIIDNYYVQYDEIFKNHPMCFIDTIKIDFPELIRICFLENANTELFLKDNNTEIKIIPYSEKFSNYSIHNESLNSLIKEYYQIQKNQCLILIEPLQNIDNFNIPISPKEFYDVYLTTSNKNKIGNGLSSKEYLEIYTYKNDKKISLCAYGIPEFKLYPFENSNQYIVKHLINWKDITYYGLFNFNIIK